MNLPAFITFTGADDGIDADGIARMVALSERYPIEWGVLFSESKRGQPRYPMPATINRIAAAARENGMRISAHFCGQYSRFLHELGALPIYRDFDMHGFLAEACDRAQMNTSEPITNMREIRAWFRDFSVSLVLQCTGAFPRSRFADVNWLFDASGGNGIRPDFWPHPDGDALPQRRGYAGGISPENVAAAVALIGEHDDDYWIDMESSLRTPKLEAGEPVLRVMRGEWFCDDFFDLDKCEAVCRAVYGEGRPA